MTLEERNNSLIDANREAQMEIAAGIDKVIKETFQLQCNNTALSDAQFIESFHSQWLSGIHEYLCGLRDPRFDTRNLLAHDFVPTVEGFDVESRDNGTINVKASPAHVALKKGEYTAAVYRDGGLG